MIDLKAYRYALRNMDVDGLHAEYRYVTGRWLDFGEESAEEATAAMTPFEREAYDWATKVQANYRLLHDAVIVEFDRRGEL